MPYYSIEIANPDGTPIDHLVDVPRIEASRSANSAGAFSFTLPDIYDASRLHRNSRVKIFRHFENGASSLLGNTVWFVNQIRENVSEQTIQVRGMDSIGLIGTRIVAYTPQTTFADKTAEELGSAPPADKMMHDYMDENFGSGALDTDRTVAWLNINPVDDVGPSMEKTAAWAGVLSTIQEIARTSEELGTPLFFDVLPNGDNFAFQIWTKTRGSNRGIDSMSPLVFSPDLENFSDVTLTDDFSDEVNYLYVGGFDSGASRVIVEVESDSATIDPFNRKEAFVDGGDADVESVLRDFGRNYLQGRRPRRILEGSIVEQYGYTMGIDFYYGDTVIGRAKGREFNCTINAFSLNYREGEDRMGINLRGVNYL